MRKILNVLLVALFVSLLPAGIANGSIGVYVNEDKINLSKPPLMVNGRVMVPMREVFNALGASVKWDPQYQAVYARKGNNKYTDVGLAIDLPKAYVVNEIPGSGRWMSLDTAPKMINNTTYIPLRFIGEALGGKVVWDENTNSVYIKLDDTGQTQLNADIEYSIKLAVQSMAKGTRNKYLPILIWDMKPNLNDYFKYVANQPSIKLEGYTKPNSVLEINGVKAKVYPDGQYELMVTLSEGINKFNYKGYDAIGHLETMSQEILYLPYSPSYPSEDPLVNPITITPSEIYSDARFALATIYAKGSNEERQGSGFIVNPNGILVTNNHVIEGANSIKVKIFNNDYEVEKVLGVLADKDIAVLKLKGDNFNYVDITPVSLFASEGDTVYALGNPLGLEGTITEGIISRHPFGEPEYIQFTAPISPGNSGGPLFNSRGEVIGITTFKVMGEGTEGLSFALPTKYIWEAIYPDMFSNRP